MAWSDAELVRKTLSGDRDAFGALVERHRRAVFALALQRGFQPAEADDVAQEVFLKAYGSLDTLQEPRFFERWLYGILAHVSADRSRERHRRREESGFERAPEPAAPADDFVLQGLGPDRTEVLRAMEGLSEEHRVVVTLRYMQGLGPKEIAERLGEPRGTIRSRLHHALVHLQRALEGTFERRPSARLSNPANGGAEEGQP